MSKQHSHHHANAPQGNPMTKSDASRIQAAEAKQNGGSVSKDGFAARAQRAAEHHQNNKK